MKIKSQKFCSSISMSKANAREAQQSARFKNEKIREEIRSANVAALVEDVRQYVLTANHSLWNEAVNIIAQHGSESLKTMFCSLLLDRTETAYENAVEHVVLSFEPSQITTETLLGAVNLSDRARKYCLLLLAKRYPLTAIDSLARYKGFGNTGGLNDKERIYVFQNLDIASYMSPLATGMIVIQNCVDTLIWAKENALDSLASYGALMKHVLSVISKDTNIHSLATDMLIASKILPKDSTELAELIERRLSFRYMCEYNKAIYNSGPLVLLAMTVDGLFGVKNPMFWPMLQKQIAERSVYIDPKTISFKSEARNTIFLINKLSQSGALSFSDIRVKDVLHSFCKIENNPRVNQPTDFSIANNDLTNPSQTETYRKFISGLFSKEF